MGKTYFASDFHLGVPNYEESLNREKKIVNWLKSIESECDALYLLGDVFDFWFEYKTVVPKYFTRILGQLASMTDAGISVYFFRGNHDMWTFDYLTNEIGLIVVDEALECTIGDQAFFLHHGDALIKKKERTYSIIRSVFRSSLGKWLFHRLHPNFGVGLAQYLSKKSRASNSKKDSIEIPVKDEYQYQFAEDYLQSNSVDYFIFGHRHKPMDIPLSNNARLINLGDWVSYFTYAEYDGKTISLRTANSD